MTSPLLLLAAEAPQSHEPQLIDLDGTAVIQLGLFLLLMAVLRQFLWKPYLKVRGERTTRVDGYREEAARLEAEAAARLAKAEAALSEARRIGAGERAEARAVAQRRENELLAAANASAQKTLADARARVTATLQTERTKLQQTASEVGLQAARKILGREVSA
jgi:F0F1-type ATP synthase membrane subunit b/b'